MIQSPWPKTLNEAVKICLLTLTAEDKRELENTSEEDLIMIHCGWVVTMRNEFGIWQGNDKLIRSCRAGDPDGASMTIVREVWEALQRRS